MEDKPEPSTDKKRKRVADTESDSVLNNGDSLDFTLSLEKSLTFSDTMAALRMMRAQFPNIEKVSVQPFILRSQLYSCLKDRTQVDRELESLKRERILRVFKLNTGQDDHAIMFLEDYILQGQVTYVIHLTPGLPNWKPVERCWDYVSKKIKIEKEGNFAVFDWFKTHVIMSKLDPSISHQELCSLLSAGGNVKDEHISLLINAGVLTRQLIDPNMYWFAIPNIGLILKGLSQGRKELLSLLNRRKYKEMMLAPLEKKRLRFSSLDMRFHLRDLIGTGHLRTVQTPTGLVARVLKE